MEYYFKHNISLPIYVDLKKNELARVIKTIKNFLKSILNLWILNNLKKI